MQQSLSEYMDGLKAARHRRDEAGKVFSQAKKDYAIAFKPRRTDPTPEEMNDLYNMCQPRGNYRHRDLFICIALLLYCPEALYGGAIHTKLAKMIAKTLNFSHIAVYMARKRISLWMTCYPDFFKEVSRLYSEIIGTDIS